ncbi:MAG: hypothetical protein ACYCVY_09190 [Acidiferrobacteraceae bacterium]|jgi:hypothetical protein
MTGNTASCFFSGEILCLKRQRLKPYEKFAEMIDHHWGGIAAYCEPQNTMVGTPLS